MVMMDSHLEHMMDTKRQHKCSIDLACTFRLLFISDYDCCIRCLGALVAAN